MNVKQFLALLFSKEQNPHALTILCLQHPVTNKQKEA